MPVKKELAEVRAQIKALEDRQYAICRASLAAPDAEKQCDDWLAEVLTAEHDRIEYPITVTGVVHPEAPVLRSVAFGDRVPGAWVAVRPVDATLCGKTFLGVLLGHAAIGAGVMFHAKTGVLEVRLADYNPAIWVPDLARVVFGYESWWGILKGPEDLHQITDADINGIWYVQALKSLTKGAE